MSGFVSFVSSGPGDPELLTVKAVKRLQEAEVVLFDDLSAGPILEHVSPEADLIGVGKRAGRLSPKQDHVSRLLVEHALTGARVVRLKSGDAGVFGRLEEELTALKAAGVAFEIIPGVTAASSAAAAAMIPLTRRLTARRVQFITGHGESGALPEDLNMAALADRGGLAPLDPSPAGRGGIDPRSKAEPPHRGKPCPSAAGSRNVSACADPLRAVDRIDDLTKPARK